MADLMRPWNVELARDLTECLSAVQAEAASLRAALEATTAQIAAQAERIAALEARRGPGRPPKSEPQQEEQHADH